MRNFANKARDVDKTYGIYNKGNHLYIGDTRIDVNDYNIIVCDKEYEGTPGLWEFIVMRIPNDNVYAHEDYEKYADIMVKTNSLRQGNNPDNVTPKASRGWKWNYLLKTYGIKDNDLKVRERL